ncbi:hypothetical protein BgAZ_404440 [Babesia gibsoni]|uniref:Phospholipid/glycerol acyltransferase domain-containing protein n=1 Tax=Babesia gibsoni TaxID=33632 RepID=A0AAD8PD65_BABGI|nr:hypothetical protein BgAZ_404440 [Babesia gibsoni]
MKHEESVPVKRHSVTSTLNHDSVELNAGGALDYESIRVTSQPGILKRWSLQMIASTWTICHFYISYQLVLEFKGYSQTSIPPQWLRLRVAAVAVFWFTILGVIRFCLRYYRCVKFHLDNLEEFPNMYRDHKIQTVMVHQDLKNYRLYLQIFGAIFLSPFRVLSGASLMGTCMCAIAIPKIILGDRLRGLTDGITVIALRVMAILGLWLMGVCEVKTVFVGGRPQQPNSVISNHIGVMDVMYMAMEGSYSYVCKKSLETAPYVNHLINVLQCITVERTCQAHRKTAYAALVNRIKSIHEGNEARSLVVYPEGSATQGNVLLPFRNGAFGALLPLQPLIVVLDYDYMNLTFDAFPFLWWINNILCNPFPVKFIAYWLPTIQPPSQEEIQLKGYRECVKEYAQRAHATMREALIKLNPKVDLNLMKSDTIGIPPSLKRMVLSRLYGPLIQKSYKISDDDLKNAKLTALN